MSGVRREQANPSKLGSSTGMSNTRILCVCMYMYVVVRACESGMPGILREQANASKPGSSTGMPVSLAVA